MSDPIDNVITRKFWRTSFGAYMIQWINSVYCWAELVRKMFLKVKNGFVECTRIKIKKKSNILFSISGWWLRLLFTCKAGCESRDSSRTICCRIRTARQTRSREETYRPRRTTARKTVEFLCLIRTYRSIRYRPNSSKPQCPKKLLLNELDTWKVGISF